MCVVCVVLKATFVDYFDSGIFLCKENQCHWLDWNGREIEEDGKWFDQ